MTNSHDPNETQQTDGARADFSDLNIAVLLPCYNEGQSIASVVHGFRDALPHAHIYVFDNNSTDNTATEAAAAGALVVTSRRQGKGNVVRQMFADIEADLYVMADGDGTYDPVESPLLIETLLTDRSDMIVGTRREIRKDAGRGGHAFGNNLFNRIYRLIFGHDFIDIFSGYRVFTRRFAKSFPAASPGFEIETEMSVHASILRLPVSEIEVSYGRREEGSESKLSTFRDGFRILRMMAMLMKETRPFLFFAYVATAFLALSVILAGPVIRDYFETGLVDRMPTWVLAVTLLVLAVLAMFTGTVLDSVARGRAEQKRILYLSLPAARGEKYESGVDRIHDRRSAGAAGDVSTRAEEGPDSRAV